jgi:hypothetical protein
MTRLAACLAVGSMFFALISAPLFHLHERDDHNGMPAIIHAHLPESGHRAPYSGSEIERHDSHAQVRWLDVLTVSSPVLFSQPAVAGLTERLALPSPSTTRAVVSIQNLHVHSPPATSDTSLRSPPSL